MSQLRPHNFETGSGDSLGGLGHIQGFYSYISETGILVSILANALYVVATPIGNLQDISLRALEILSKADLILVEDTRHSAHLLKSFSIHTPVRSLHEHNERKLTADIIQRLLSGKAIALISDAGTPLINDPGYLLVKAAHAHDIRVIPIPGPCALVTALSVSGLATERFVYEGFLPAKRPSRLKHLKELSQERRTLVFYEAPHRILVLLEDLIQCFGSQRIAFLAKELTKYHETIRKGCLCDLHAWLLEDARRRSGEFVLIMEGLAKPASDRAETLRVLRLLLRHLPVKEAVAVTAGILGGNRNKLYALAIQQDLRDS